MKSLFTVFTIAVLIFSFATFSSADAGSPAPAAAMTVACPTYVDTRIVNPPQGWSPFSLPGGAQIKFQRIRVVQNLGKPTVVCEYTNSQTDFAIHMLKREFPTNYVCSVDKAGNTPWRATCAPRIKIN